MIATDYYEVTTPPVGLPVTLDELKDYARIDFDDDDAFLTAALTAATDLVEKFTNRWLIERSADGFFPAFDCSRFEKYVFLEVRKSPLKSISSVSISDGSVYQVMTDYILKNKSGYSRILFNDYFNNISYNSEDNLPYFAKVSFVAGYGDADAVPEALKTAILAMANYIYENRADCVCDDGSISATMPKEVRLMAGPYVIRSTFG